ncbi:NXPE family member 1-like isoform X1 [Podarcis muralis]
MNHSTTKDGGSTIGPVKGDTPSCNRMEWTNKDEEVKSIIAKLDQMMPNVTFTDIMTTTSAQKSEATLLNDKGFYCVGDPLLVQLDLYNHLGKRKEYGGDFLQARIISSSLNAGASGSITDYRNGTYLVNFTLFWPGNVKVSLMLIHPSEGVSALWAARKKGYGKIAFVGTFLNGTSTVSSDCGYNIRVKERCEYLDERDQEAFYCVKPNNVPCDALIRLKTYNEKVTYLTDLEHSLLNRSNIGCNIPQCFGTFQVIVCKGKKATVAEGKCGAGMSYPSPSGFVWKKEWYPVFCQVLSFRNLKRIKSCLKRKIIYLLGDSTLRQWMRYITDKIQSFQYFDLHGTGKQKNMMALDMKRNSQIQWKKHNHPFVTVFEYMTADHSYIAREIDNVAGDGDTVVAVSLGHHFRPFPIELFIRRMINIRAAIQRLLVRSPDTKVIIKAENTREMSIDQERFGNFHGYAQYLVLKDIFRDLKVGFIDAWDMAIAYGTNLLHPPDHVVGSQIDMFLSYIC